PTDPPRVSVIIPAHNSMPELTRCVTSAMEQTLGLDKIEIIAVDDGSTDGTGPNWTGSGAPALPCARRVVTGEEHQEDYYTADHYASFDRVDYDC
ncbi:glycosyltransferase family 2 protein, partial [Streptomyces deserti]